MKPTEFIYSSHDRCERIHRDHVVQRALESWTNKTLFYLPFSSPSRGDQEYSWGTFEPYFNRFRGWGLVPRTFFWTEALAQEDIDLFFDWLANSEVVVLGGGRTLTGLERYAWMGERGYGDPGRFLRVIQERSARGLLTVGFSAGADQLAEWSCDEDSSVHCYGAVARTVARLHYEPAAEESLNFLARTHPDCLVFGLPNDSGISSVRGTTPGGRPFQVLRFVLDASWNKPEDQWHIKTRQGVAVEHRYADGRDWKFRDGDVLVRVFHHDAERETEPEVFFGGPGLDRFWDRATQQPTEHRDLEAILQGR